jgi:hypothetical protein
MEHQRDLTELSNRDLRSLSRTLRNLRSGGHISPDQLWNLGLIERELEERGVRDEDKYGGGRSPPTA